MSTDTQSELAYKLLKKAGKHGVENFTFSQYRILRYGAVISDLRADGIHIITEQVKLPNGRSTGVWKYYLVEPKKNPWTRNIFRKVVIKEIE